MERVSGRLIVMLIIGNIDWWRIDDNGDDEQIEHQIMVMKALIKIDAVVVCWSVAEIRNGRKRTWPWWYDDTKPKCVRDVTTDDNIEKHLDMVMTIDENRGIDWLMTWHWWAATDGSARRGSIDEWAAEEW